MRKASTTATAVATVGRGRVGGGRCASKLQACDVKHPSAMRSLMNEEQVHLSFRDKPSHHGLACKPSIRGRGRRTCDHDPSPFPTEDAGRDGTGRTSPVRRDGAAHLQRQPSTQIVFGFLYSWLMQLAVLSCRFVQPFCAAVGRPRGIGSRYLGRNPGSGACHRSIVIESVLVRPGEGA